MKTKNINKSGNSLLIVSLMLITAAAFGQGRSQRAQPVNNGNNRGTVHYESGARNSRSSGNVVSERSNNNNDINRIVYREKPNNPQPKTGNYETHGNKSWHQDKMSHDQYNKINYNHYDHPRTYNEWHYPAPWEYARHAMVFRHNHGDYYYYNGSFYRYHPNRGYFVINFPAHVLFSCLPEGYEEIYINGRVFYRYGDIYFIYTPEGYRIIPRPYEAYMTWQF